MKNEQTIQSLTEQLAAISARKSSPTAKKIPVGKPKNDENAAPPPRNQQQQQLLGNSKIPVRGKSINALKRTEKSKQVEVAAPKNDENAAPPPRNQQEAKASGKPEKSTQNGKQQQCSRVAAIRAAGGRKGLSEQLKRARRFGEK